MIKKFFTGLFIYLFYIQKIKRYISKNVQLPNHFLPNYYCTSAGGHVHSGETYQEAAVRELKEEIGITNAIQEADSFIFTGENGHQRLIKVFVTKASDGFSFTDGEVSEGAFFSISDAKNLIDSNEKIHPQLKACFDRLFERNFF